MVGLHLPLTDRMHLIFLECSVRPVVPSTLPSSEMIHLRVHHTRTHDHICAQDEMHSDLCFQCTRWWSRLFHVWRIIQWESVNDLIVHIKHMCHQLVSAPVNKHTSPYHTWSPSQPDTEDSAKLETRIWSSIICSTSQMGQM